MGKYCPGCGSEIKEGSKFCQNCGAQIQIETISSTFEDQVAQPPRQQVPVQTPPPSLVPPPQQQTGQTQAYAPMPPKKSNNKLIATIVAIVVVVVIIGIIYFLFLGSGSDSRFVGEWEQESGYITVPWIFKSDGSFEFMGIEGNWRVSGDQLCIETVWEEISGEMCYDYVFSDNGNTLTLTYNGAEYAVLTKK